MRFHQVTIWQKIQKKNAKPFISLNKIKFSLVILKWNSQNFSGFFFHFIKKKTLGSTFFPCPDWKTENFPKLLLKNQMQNAKISHRKSNQKNFGAKEFLPSYLDIKLRFKKILKNSKKGKNFSHQKRNKNFSHQNGKLIETWNKSRLGVENYANVCKSHCDAK